MLVQTFSPEHPAIVAAGRHDYERFADGELPVRREFGYPPFTGSVRLVVRGSSETVARHFADQLVERIGHQLAEDSTEARVLGPAPAPITKLRGKFRFHVLVYGPAGDALRRAVRQGTLDLKPPSDVQWIVDVDPFGYALIKSHWF